MMWIIPAMIAAVANVGRDIYIKKRCDESSHIIVACTRITAFFMLLFLFPLMKQEIKFDPSHKTEFVIYMAITVVLTMVATVLKVRVVQTENISITEPLMTLTPIFILPWGYLLLGETATPIALFGILISIAGALLVVTAHKSNKTKSKNQSDMPMEEKSYSQIKKSLFFIFINLLIVGLTTNIDKIEIGYSSAYLYTLIWTGCSGLLGLYTIVTIGLKNFLAFLFSKKNLLQAFFWTVGFYMQQVAVSMSFDISMNTAYIKSISYVGIILSVVFGGKLFKEQGLKKKLLGTVVIVAGNLVILFFR